VVSFALSGIDGVNSQQNSDKVEWAQTSSVLAARHSIIADAVESSFIVNGRAIRLPNGDVGVWVGPNSAEASQPIPLTKFCRIFLLQYLVSKIGPFPPEQNEQGGDSDGAWKNRTSQFSRV